MPRQNDLLSQMEKTLQHLVENAERLVTISSQVIAEEELNLLQLEQEELVEQLVTLDTAYQQDQEPDSSKKRVEAIAHNLDRFQQLNARFIENVQKSQGVIQFELERLDQLDLTTSLLRQKLSPADKKKH